MTSRGTLSWKQLPDGMERRAAFLRAVQERDARRRPADPLAREPRPRVFKPVWILALTVSIVAVWLLR
jgi:hypothetical protein